MLYTVKHGDTVRGIAKGFGMAAEAVATANHLRTDSRLPAGMHLIIPMEAAPAECIAVNGCAVLPAEEAAIAGALPGLTFFSGYGAKAQRDGSITGEGESSLLSAAAAAGTVPLVGITNQNETGERDPFIFRDSAASKLLVQNICAMLGKNGTLGINLDFEGIPPGDDILYGDFVKRLRDSLGEAGRCMAVTVHTGEPRSSGALYRTFGEIADCCIVSPWDRGCQSGTPEAAAPAYRLKEGTDKAAEFISPAKILLEIPGYGCNRRLPMGKHNPVCILPLDEAAELANAQPADIRYDPDAQSACFRYYHSTGREHIAWFDDPLSISEKLDMAAKHGLGGISIWNINRLYRPMWLVLREKYRVKKLL